MALRSNTAYQIPTQMTFVTNRPDHLRPQDSFRINRNIQTFVFNPKHWDTAIGAV